MFLSTLLYHFSVLVTASNFSLFVLHASCVSMQVFYYVWSMSENSLGLIYHHPCELFEGSSYLSTVKEPFAFLLLIILKNNIYLISVIDLTFKLVAWNNQLIWIYSDQLSALLTAWTQKTQMYITLKKKTKNKQQPNNRQERGREERLRGI